MRFVKELAREDMPDITDIATEGDITTVKFSDRTNISVKRSESDKDTIYAAIAYAITKRFYGHSIYKDVDRILKEKNPIRNDAATACANLYNAQTHEERVSAQKEWEKYPKSLRRSVLDSIPSDK